MTGARLQFTKASNAVRNMVLPQNELQPHTALLKVSRFFPTIANSKNSKQEANFS